MPCLGYHLVHLEARQLSAFARLGTLCHLDLNLFSVYQIFGGYAEASRCHLLGLARQRDAVYGVVESFRILATLTGIAAAAYLVHGKADGFMCLLAQCSERHGSCHEVLHDGFHGFHLVDVDGVLLESHEVTNEDGCILLVSQPGEFLELLVAACPGGQLQGGDGFGVPGVADAVLSPMELALEG